MIRKKILNWLIPLTIVVLTGCSGGGDTSSSGDDKANKAPIVNAGNDKTTIINQPLTIRGTATDKDGTISTYEWRKGSDTLGTEISLIYIPTKIGIDILTFIATDDDGNSGSDEIRVTVKEENSDFGGNK